MDVFIKTNSKPVMKGSRVEIILDARKQKKTPE